MTQIEKKPLTPIKAIRAKCLDCVCDQPKEVRLCPIHDCPLYAFRMGTNPNRTKKGMDDTPTQATDGEIDDIGDMDDTIGIDYD